MSLLADVTTSTLAWRDETKKFFKERKRYQNFFQSNVCP